MEPIHFETVVGTDRLIHAPVGVPIPVGAIEVTIRPVDRVAVTDADPVQPTHAWLLECAAEAEKLSCNLPCDMAEHHDHYAHGTPLP
jgi:hypothetical protein